MRLNFVSTYSGEDHSISNPEERRGVMLLKDGQKLREKLEELKFGLLLVGHQHIPGISKLVDQGDIFECRVGSACQVMKSKKANHFLVYKITIDSSGNFLNVLPINYLRTKRNGADLAFESNSDLAAFSPPVVLF